MSDNVTERVEYCPACGDSLSYEPDGNRVYECPNHGEIITNLVICSTETATEDRDE